jgi:putative endonuclease
LKPGYVYILTNKPYGTLYIGVTSNLQRRLYEHKNQLIPGFTSKYAIHNLVYVNYFERLEDGIADERRLKNWRRQWKINLIQESNPNWNDLSDDYI